MHPQPPRSPPARPVPSLVEGQGSKPAPPPRPPLRLRGRRRGPAPIAPRNGQGTARSVVEGALLRRIIRIPAHPEELVSLSNRRLEGQTPPRLARRAWRGYNGRQPSFASFRERRVVVRAGARCQPCSGSIDYPVPSFQGQSNSRYRKKEKRPAEDGDRAEHWASPIS